MSLQVKELSAKGLVHEYKIAVPAKMLEEAMTNRLMEIGRTVKLDGFRPGKAPITVLQKRYGESVRSEVIDRTINESADKALTDKGLRPALQPSVDNVKAETGSDLEFTMRVEVFPEIKPMDFTTLTLERFVAEVAEDKVTEGIMRIAKARRGPEFVKEDRKTKDGDVLVIDFEGESEGKAHDGMKGQNHRLELGSKTFIEGFETQLLGAKKNDVVTVKVTFPEEYPSENLAGKKATFKVTVKDIMAYDAIALNDELAKEIGFDSMDALKKRVREQMNEDLKEMSHEVTKRFLLDALSEKHSFDLPPGLLEQEFNAIWRQVEQAKAKGQSDPGDRGKSDEELKEEYQGIAERRVRLGLLLSEVGRLNKIRITENELRTALMQEASRFPGQENTVYEFYRKTPGALQRLEAPLLEQKVVDHILGIAKITDKQSTVEELEAALKEPDKKAAAKAKAKKK